MTGPPPAVAAVRSAVRRDLAALAAPAGSLVLAAVSGGPDSVALAAALAFAAPAAGLRAGAVTVDHGLWAGSGAQAACTVELCARLGLEPVRCTRVVVGPGAGPEDAARRARYAALTAAAQELGAVAVLLGHTRDDQAEQVLLGLARGSGARALAGMPPVRGLLRRPLLALPRASTAAACADLGLDVWHDPANADPAYARARARHDALPALEAALGPGIAAALARSARLLRADADALDAMAVQALPACRSPRGLAVAPLGALAPAVRGRVLRAYTARPLSAGQVASVEALVTAWRGQGPVSLPGGGRLAREGDELVVLAPPLGPPGGPVERS